MSGTAKWDDAAVKDLTMAVLMSANNGTLNISANWDIVTETMTGWGYPFTKSAMSQQWSKKIVKQFKERHSNVKSSDDGNNGGSLETPKKAATPRKRATPKTPASGRGKKRAAVNDDDDNDTSPETGDIANPVAKQKTPRSVKKVKYEETSDNEAKVEGMAEREDEMGAAGEV